MVEGKNMVLSPLKKNRDTYMILSKYIDGAQNFLANNVFPQFPR